MNWFTKYRATLLKFTHKISGFYTYYHEHMENIIELRATEVAPTHEITDGMVVATREYILALINSFKINTENINNDSKDAYIIHPEFLNDIIEKTLREQSSTITLINNYIDLVNTHKDFDKIRANLFRLDTDIVVNNANSINVCKVCGEQGSGNKCNTCGSI